MLIESSCAAFIAVFLPVGAELVLIVGEIWDVPLSIIDGLGCSNAGQVTFASVVVCAG